MSDCDHLWATQDEIGRPYCQGCGKPWEQVRKEEAMNDVKELRAEIDRLQEAKRAALKLADERAKEANGLRQQLAKKVVVTDRMCEIALEADAVSRIQGFSYEKRHVIRDIWLELGKQEIWSSPVAGPDEYQSFQKRCRIERMRKVLEEVFALTDDLGK